VAQCLESGGTLALTDWFKKEQLGEREHKKFIEPIEKGMLVELDTMQDYATFVKSNCMRVIYSEILNKNRAKTWDLCLDIVKKKELWQALQRHASGFRIGEFPLRTYLSPRDFKADVGGTAGAVTPREGKRGPRFHRRR